MKPTVTSPPPAPELVDARRVGPIVFGLVFVFFAFLFVPRVQATPGLWGAFVGWGLLAIGAIVALAVRDRRRGTRLEIEVRVRTPHWVQLLMHTAVFVYWGLYWEQVWAQAPLILAQVAFAYLCELILSWRRYGRFRLGFGPWPVTGSTNLFLWWLDPYFGAQFAMIALAYLSREFIRWKRGGQTTHIFNPSAIGLAIAALVMVVGEVAHLTWGYRISLTLGQPTFCYEWIFAVGLVVMVLFRVTLTTAGAAASMLTVGFVYHAITGDYMYLDTAIPIAVFLGMNLLITDPVSSPRSGAGKLIFGALYGLMVFAFYPLLGELGRDPSGADPGLHVTFLDKLLPVPILNLCVRRIDALVERLPTVRWPITGATANYAHVALWAVLFLLMRPQLSGHPGRSIDYWEQACREDRDRGCETLIAIYERACASGIGGACHNLGVVFAQGLPDIPPDAERSVSGFDRGCALDFAPSCGEMGVALLQGTLVTRDPGLARTLLDRGCTGGDGASCAALGQWMLTEASPPDPTRARALLQTACRAEMMLGCHLHAELLRTGRGGPRDAPAAAELYRRACLAGHGPACDNGALMRWTGDGVPVDRPGALELLRRGCDLGRESDCDRLRSLGAEPP